MLTLSPNGFVYESGWKYIRDDIFQQFQLMNVSALIIILIAECVLIIDPDTVNRIPYNSSFRQKNLTLFRVFFLKKYVALLFLLFSVLVLAQSPAVQAQTVKEYVTVDSLAVGDRFSYTLTLNKEQPYEEVIFPDSTHFESSFEIRSRQQFRITGLEDSLIYQLQFFGTEDTIIPKLPVKLVNGTDTTTVYTKPVPVYFKSVLQAGDDSLHPLKPIFDFASAWWPYLVALLLLVLAGWYAYKFYKSKSAEPKKEPKPEFQPTPFIDPLETLASSLQQLKDYSFGSQKDFKQFYINLGDAIRLYFERLYHIPALESTSREILTEMNRRVLDEELIGHTRRVLNEADMVKFARFTPSEEQAQDALAKADAFLTRARQVDGPRIDHMRRQHLSSMEIQQKQFEEQLYNEEEV